jgi:hypothetical protein
LIFKPNIAGKSTVRRGLGQFDIMYFEAGIFGPKHFKLMKFYCTGSLMNHEFPTYECISYILVHTEPKLFRSLDHVVVKNQHYEQ